MIIILFILRGLRATNRLWGATRQRRNEKKTVRAKLISACGSQTGVPQHYPSTRHCRSPATEYAPGQQKAGSGDGAARGRGAPSLLSRARIWLPRCARTRARGVRSALTLTPAYEQQGRFETSFSWHPSSASRGASTGSQSHACIRLVNATLISPPRKLITYFVIVRACRYLSFQITLVS